MEFAGDAWVCGDVSVQRYRNRTAFHTWGDRNIPASPRNPRKTIQRASPWLLAELHRVVA